MLKVRSRDSYTLKEENVESNPRCLCRLLALDKVKKGLQKRLLSVSPNDESQYLVGLR